MTYHNIYPSKNDYIFEVSAPSNKYKQAVAFYNNNAINADAPELSGALAGQNCKFNLKNILANASVFPGIAIADLPAVYSSVDFMRAIMMRTNNVGNTDYADADPIKFVPAYVSPMQLKTIDGNLSQWLGTNKKFYGFAPTQKVTSSNSAEYLYYLNSSTDNITTFTLSIVVYKGTQKQTFSSTINSVMNQLVVINTSWSRIQALHNLDDTVTSYEVQLLLDGVALTEVYRYYPEHYPVIWGETLYFKNNLGVIETFSFDTLAKQDIETENFSFETDQQITDYLSIVTHKIRFKTAVLPQYWLKYLSEELLTSKEIYWAKNGKFYRMARVSSSQTTVDPTQKNEVFEIDLKLASTDYR